RFSRDWSSDVCSSDLEKLRKHQASTKLKHENKSIALGTSKINYMDPRVTVAYAKRVEMPIEKVFPKALCDKFNWAMHVRSNFVRSEERRVGKECRYRC